MYTFMFKYICTLTHTLSVGSRDTITYIHVHVRMHNNSSPWCKLTFQGNHMASVIEDFSNCYRVSMTLQAAAIKGAHTSPQSLDQTSL